MTHSLAANDDIVLVRPNLTPYGEDRLLREAAQVDELTLRGDLAECCPICLADGNKFASVIRDPAPGGGALAGEAAKVGVALEVEEINLKKMS